MPTAPGRGRDPVAVVLPGSGSTAGFVRRAFGPALAAAGYRLVTPQPVAGPGVVAAAVAALDDACARYDVRLVGGISLGAHIAACWAGADAAGGDGVVPRPRSGGAVPGRPRAPRLAGLLLALPAWTGPPSAVAAASARAAAEVDRHGTAGALGRVRSGGGPGWVTDELAAAWPRYGPALAATLRAAATAPGPDPAVLRRIDLPAGIVAFRDDPLHPAAVAAQWAALLPRCRVEWLRLADCAADRGALGTAAVRAWHLAEPAR